MAGQVVVVLQLEVAGQVVVVLQREVAGQVVVLQLEALQESKKLGVALMTSLLSSPDENSKKLNRNLWAGRLVEILLGAA